MRRELRFTRFDLFFDGFLTSDQLAISDGKAHAFQVEQLVEQSWLSMR